MASGTSWSDTTTGLPASSSADDIAMLDDCDIEHGGSSGTTVVMSGCRFTSAELFYNPVAYAYVWKVLEPAAARLLWIDDSSLESIESIGPDNDGFVQANIRHLRMSNNNDTVTDSSNPTPTSTEWVSYTDVSGVICTSALALDGAVHGISQVIDHDTGEFTRTVAYCPRATPSFNGCIGIDCMDSNYFRQQTTYYRVKKSRDMAKSYAYNVFGPSNTSNIKPDIDNGSAICGPRQACYSNITKKLYLQHPDASANNLHYFPMTIGHEYGHHLTYQYSSYPGIECNWFFGYAGAIKEATASLAALVMLEREQGFSASLTGFSRTMVDYLGLRGHSLALRNRILFVLGHHGI